jgi:hypothetical protein
VHALLRRVKVRPFVHDALNLGTPPSRAIEELRRDAQCQDGDLSVYSAEAGTGRDRPLHPLFHVKLVVSDDRKLLLGSANLTCIRFDPPSTGASRRRTHSDRLPRLLLTSDAEAASVAARPRADADGGVGEVGGNQND